MVGEEASFFALCDGEHFVTLVPSQDHKAIYEGDKGPNTGGMGAYAPAPVMTPELVRDAETRIIQPVLDEMRRMGIPYQGVLYCGLMFTEEGPKVVEFNARFGDPECQILMPLIQGDIVVYHAGTARCEGGFCTDSGRVLCVTAIGADIQTAVAKVYSAVDQISFDNAYCRRDIAHRALARDS